jgi:hypothetical protein
MSGKMGPEAFERDSRQGASTANENAVSGRLEIMHSASAL